jgi:hypothetical protein
VTPASPTTEVTDEQRAAWRRVRGNPVPGSEWERAVELLAPLLPSNLTDPQPALPTEAGWYADPDDNALRLDGDGTWWAGEDTCDPTGFGPFRRLVVEREPITREQIRAKVGPVLTNAMNYPEEISSKILGRDLSSLIAKVTDALDALVNGADQ